MQVGATAQEKSKVLSFRMKIQGLTLMVVLGNGLVEGIVLRATTFFRVKTRDL
jgi:hypothetical protein